jgi:hypothetical protein
MTDLDADLKRAEALIKEMLTQTETLKHIFFVEDLRADLEHYATIIRMYEEE